MKAIDRSGSRRAGRAARMIGGGVLVFVLSVGGYFGALHLTGNFHSVVAGALYRSAQPTTFDIARYQKTYGIKTIINLRGENRGSSWYDDRTFEALEPWLGFPDS
jgi:protein tyrosine/serine phosphatase